MKFNTDNYYVVEFWSVHHKEWLPFNSPHNFPSEEKFIAFVSRIKRNNEKGLYFDKARLSLFERKESLGF